jgi:hypothetical protein
MEAHIQSLHPHYAHIQIAHIRRRGGGRQILLHGVGEGYCLNKGGNHNSSKIYFHIDSEGITTQRCWSHSMPSGAQVPCRDFAIPLPLRMMHEADNKSTTITHAGEKKKMDSVADPSSPGAMAPTITISSVDVAITTAFSGLFV